jgi:hypothetical protein
MPLTTREQWCEPGWLVFEFKHSLMKVFSLILLVAGWFLVVAAIAMLKPAFIPVFTIAGLAIEFLGFGLLARAQSASQLISRQERRF